MLTRLKVNGFKNLVDVDVRFGPFTCIAGPNGVGKSNLFDAIHFLSLLADRTLLDAANEVRGSDLFGVRNLFHRSGSAVASQMSFEAEFIVPDSARDDLGQLARPSSTFLRYRLTLAYRENPAAGVLGGLEVQHEELQHIPKGEAHQHLLFEHRARSWRASAVSSRRWAPYYISTVGEGDDRVVKVSQDGGGGMPRSYLATKLPRTVLSSTYAAESPTCLVARREIQSWQILQFEPSALRKPDPFTDTFRRLGANGSHLAATLYRLAHRSGAGEDESYHPENLYAEIANRLAELYEDVRDVTVELDERRELLTVLVRTLDGTPFASSSLSDGTLRFLALAVLEADPEAQGVLCLEEPENGVHPARLVAMLRLLQDFVTDVDLPISDDNPLRQVVVNTHSPAVVQLVPDDSLLMARTCGRIDARGRHSVGVGFSPLSETWRTRAEKGPSPVPLGELLAYLNPRSLASPDGLERGRVRARRVGEREDIDQLLLPLALSGLAHVPG